MLTERDSGSQMWMKQFFDPRGQSLDLTSWCDLYGSYYFLNGPKWGRKINSRNQTSPFVESEAICILNQTQPLNYENLKFIFGWKLGQINHRDSEQKQQVSYKLDWSQHLIAHMQFDTPDFSAAISWLTDQMPHIQTLTPEATFDLYRELDKIGPIYILTLLFFLSHGQWPIYDKYAAIAVEAITLGQAPESNVRLTQLSSWRQYKVFVNKVCWLFGCQNISREQDRALWAYGHFFSN